MTGQRFDGHTLNLSQRRTLAGAFRGNAGGFGLLCHPGSLVWLTAETAESSLLVPNVHVGNPASEDRGSRASRRYNFAYR